MKKLNDKQVAALRAATAGLITTLDGHSRGTLEVLYRRGLLELGGIALRGPGHNRSARMTYAITGLGLEALR